MKKLLLLTSLIALTVLAGFSQNKAPNAVNDTFYVNFNDSISLMAPSVPIYANDSDPDGDNIFIDTALYNGTGFFSFNTVLTTSTISFVRFNYKPSVNFWGLDSVLYILRDNGIPTKYDTAWVYFKVKHQEFQQLDLNNINARLGLNQLFHDATNSISAFEVPKGSGSNTIYAANLWIAGKNQDSVYLDAVTFASLSPSTLTQFVSRSGPIMDSIYYKEYDYEWDRLWKITSNEINYHIANWNNSGYQPIEVIANWPAHGDTSKGQAYYLAPFIDNNGDGMYNCYDGDYPKIKGQQAVYFIYHDVNYSSSYSGGPVLNSETHYMAYAYNCPSDSAINNTIFLDYTIYNRSNLTYDSTYIGMWVDLDIGNSNDDYVGCDVARSTFYGYNADAFDEDANGIFGYQNYPPAQGITFLKGAPQDDDGMDNPLTTNVAQAYSQNGIVYPNLGLGFGDGIADNEYWGMEHFMYYSQGGWITGDPENSTHYHNYLKGHWKDGSQMVWGGNGHFSGGGTIPTKYLFPDISDPLWYGTYGISTTPNAWSEFSSGFPPGDRRGLGSTGPFTFEPDSSIEITLAFVFGRDYQNTGNTAGLVVMQERVDSIHSYYRNGFTTTACGSALSVKERIEDDNLLRIYPNPFNGIITVDYVLETQQAQLRVFDVYGKLVKEKTLYTYQSIIDLSQEASGIYFIQVMDGNNVLTKKVVKQ